jgi:hypothetical protein
VAWVVFAALATLTFVIYLQGLNGGFLFDDFPNIADNDGIKPEDASLASLVRSALSSPSSEFKRPLASLSFAANYLATGLDPAPMKLTNVLIHLINGLLVFLFVRMAARIVRSNAESHSPAFLAAWVAGLWLLLPINLTSVLYVVQRMESLANLFVLAGLLGYTATRWRMQRDGRVRHLVVAITCVILCTGFGLLAKETAVLLPLYAFFADAILFRFRSAGDGHSDGKLDGRIIAAYTVILLIPLIIGLIWLMPGLLNPSAWSTRDFTLRTRLLTEARVVTDYIAWTLVPTPTALSFYHDQYIISQGVFSPWTSAAAALLLAALIVLAIYLRQRAPLVSLGLALFFSCHALTATILPLELVYEHRNYFASMGLLIAVVPLLANGNVLTTARRTVLVAMFLQAAGLLFVTAKAWDSPLTLASELASRAPDSPRAQYELGRTYVIYSHYDSNSPFVPKVYPVLERAMNLKGSSILPEQALIFFNARLHRPIEDAWWDSLTHKLATQRVTVQDESALGALVECKQGGSCDLPSQQLLRAFLAAVDHPARSPRLLAMYGNFSWNVLKDRDLGLRMCSDAMHGKPEEPAYRITVIRMLAAMGRIDEAQTERNQLARMNIGGALDGDLASVDRLLSK